MRLKIITHSAQALAVTFFLVVIMGALAFVIADMWADRLMLDASDRNALVALYAAQAGLERGKITALSGETPGGGAQYVPCNTEASSACWYKDVPNAWYRFRVNGNSGDNRDIFATGRAIGPNNVTLAERKLTVTVDVSPVSGRHQKGNTPWQEE